MRISTLLMLAVAFVFSLPTSTLEAQYFQGQSNLGVVLRPNTLRPARPVMPGNESGLINSQNGWYPYVIALPSDRRMIRQTPVELRPNRPMHFLGNSRRRMWR